jgi:hypothetical protein
MMSPGLGAGEFHHQPDDMPRRAVDLASNFACRHELTIISRAVEQLLLAPCHRPEASPEAIQQIEARDLPILDLGRYFAHAPGGSTGDSVSR